MDSTLPIAADAALISSPAARARVGSCSIGVPHSNSAELALWAVLMWVTWLVLRVRRGRA